MESLSNPLVFSLICAVLITIAIYVLDKVQSPDKQKDNGEYLRVLSASGIITLRVTKLKPSANKSMKGGNNEPLQNDIHVGNPGF